MSNIALIFPGQGSQSVGMGKDFFENSDQAKEIFNKVDEILGKSLSNICFEGPEDELKETINTQPAILAISIIAYELLKSKTDLNISFTAGHSLGEYSALYASGALDLESVVKLVKKRSELMSTAPEGAMAAILGLDEDKLELILKEARTEGLVTIANYNTPGQLVISGSPEGVIKACELAKVSGAKRALPLPVSGAFHSPLMEKPAQEFSEEVKNYSFNNVEVPVITNIDSTATTKGFDEKLVKQIYSSVLWTQTMDKMKASGIDTFIEVGPGKVLAGMVKKFDRNLKVLNVFDMASLEATINALNTEASIC